MVIAQRISSLKQEPNEDVVQYLERAESLYRKSTADGITIACNVVKGMTEKAKRDMVVLTSTSPVFTLIIYTARPEYQPRNFILIGPQTKLPLAPRGLRE